MRRQFRIFYRYPVEPNINAGIGAENGAAMKSNPFVNRFSIEHNPSQFLYGPFARCAALRQTEILRAVRAHVRALAHDVFRNESNTTAANIVKPIQDATL